MFHFGREFLQHVTEMLPYVSLYRSDQGQDRMCDREIMASLAPRLLLSGVIALALLWTSNIEVENQTVRKGPSLTI
jgi:hypothetical protein